MSVLGDSLGAVGDCLRAVGSQTVGYTPTATGVLKSIAGTWVDHGTRQEEQTDGRVEVQYGLLSNVAANDDDGVASPALGDTVTVAGVKFAVTDFTGRAGTWSIQLRRVAAKLKAGERIERW